MGTVQPLRTIVEHFKGKKAMYNYDRLECGHVIFCPLGHHALDGLQRSRPVRRRCPECPAVSRADPGHGAA